MERTLSRITEHLVALVAARRTAAPLFVALQGPQGIGKTTITRALATITSLRVAVVSLDDLYLPHHALQRVHEAAKHNKLLSGRGQPGTHDLPLAADILQRLHGINSPGANVVRVPVFDKSLHNGQGDRLPEAQATEITGLLDVVVLEGWCVGFYPLPEDQLATRYDDIVSGTGAHDGFVRDAVRVHTLDDLRCINKHLEAYAEALYPFFDAFIQLAPPTDAPLSPIYTWRLEQEHALKKQTDGRGMSDDQVKSFIDRYIPGYVFFLEGVQRGWAPNYIRTRHMAARSHHHSGESEGDGAGDATTGNSALPLEEPFEGTESQAQHPPTSTSTTTPAPAPTSAHINASTTSLSHADGSNNTTRAANRTRTCTHTPLLPRTYDQTGPNPPWKGRGLCIYLDQRRAMIGSETF
ncbi:hypothetical protein BOTBODRAFT_27441 [Botryobasidium botryosum FD-172 SS1]|uniref:Phosphoribulokinase/uridine kinase domain-containing protein n=1 Tax=Botryobasidium botryosum (strain FD-172 SS1) TaxID=930990 RepID=A0A067MW96_BOTB1|nr:hypothetical protein BOTBODRAFT_27441 [Botryobasidium botryosum FD-172 SS1]